MKKYKTLLKNIKSSNFQITKQRKMCLKMQTIQEALPIFKDSLMNMRFNQGVVSFFIVHKSKTCKQIKYFFQVN